MLFWGLIFFGIFVVALTIALKIPGIELIIRPVFALLQKLIEYTVASSAAWLIWLLRSLLRAHHDLFEHLIHDEEHFDMQLRVERANRKS